MDSKEFKELAHDLLFIAGALTVGFISALIYVKILLIIGRNSLQM